jgi:hypothetical protein
LLGAGTYYIGGLFDADGSGGAPNSGDPLQIYNDREFGVEDGDPITVSAGTTTTITFTLDDTYLYP